MNWISYLSFSQILTRALQLSLHDLIKLILLSHLVKSLVT